jgi:hypothetical protein
MRGLRVAGALGLALYGASYLWLAPAAAPGGAGGPVWAVVEVLVIVTAVGFAVAAWGLARAGPWSTRMTIAAAVAGLLTLIPYLAAVRSDFTGRAVLNAALHGLGCAAILLVLLIPPAERTLSRRAGAARDGLPAAWPIFRHPPLGPPARASARRAARPADLMYPCQAHRAGRGVRTRASQQPASACSTATSSVSTKMTLACAGSPARAATARATCRSGRPLAAAQTSGTAQPAAAMRATASSVVRSRSRPYLAATPAAAPARNGTNHQPNAAPNATAATPATAAASHPPSGPRRLGRHDG